LNINFVFMYIDGTKLPRARGFAESFLGCSRQSLLCREFFFGGLSGLSNATGFRSDLDSGIVCVRNLMPVSLRGGGGELGNLKP
jgi:hypothetical protein